MKDKKKWLKGWKVIMRDSRMSCVAHNFSSVLASKRAAVLYKRNKITKNSKNCGPLAVFKTREEARKFIKRCFRELDNTRKIVKCLYKKSEGTSYL